MSMKSFFVNILSRFKSNSRDNTLMKRLEDLENRIKVLEEENIGTTNALYEMENALEARIDILTGELWLKNDV